MNPAPASSMAEPRPPSGSIENRRSPRIFADLMVRYQRSDVPSPLVTTRSANISYEGIFIRTEEALPMGTRLMCEVYATDGTIATRGIGVVRWCRAGHPDECGVGVEFISLDEVAKERVRTLVDSIRTDENRHLTPPTVQARAPPALPKEKSDLVWAAGVAGILLAVVAVVIAVVLLTGH